MGMPRKRPVDSGQRLGRYTLIERLGAGGMAEVWKAQIAGPGGFRRTVVVKRILPHLAAEARFAEMFLREARLSAVLQHPNIVQVHELGEVDGQYFMALEYVRGRDLTTLMRARGRALPPGTAALIARDLCRALAHAWHAPGADGVPLKLVHRDVSPSNVMLSIAGEVKLLDFGIAKALAEANDQKTATGTFKGKLGYMAPELFEGGGLDHCADLFAAGVVLHEILTGKRLFKGTSELHTINLIRQAEVVPPSQLNPEVPPELDRIASKALARNVAERYHDGDEMAADLDRAAQALGARPDGLCAVFKEVFPEDFIEGPSALVAEETLERPATSSLPPAARVRPARWAPWLALASVILAGAALAVWRVQHRRAAPVEVVSAPARATPPAATATSAPPTAAPLAVPSPPAVEAARPRPVTVRVDSLPRGADVFLDGESAARGRTPLTVELARGETTHHVRIVRSGYDASQLQLVADESQRIQVTLVRAHHKDRARHATSRSVADPTEDVVDPFR